MQAHQDIGFVRRELVRRALLAYGARPVVAHSHDAGPEAVQLRDLLGEAHARVRILELAIERLAVSG
jgi:hypothetical protein